MTMLAAHSADAKEELSIRERQIEVLTYLEDHGGITARDFILARPHVFANLYWDNKNTLSSEEDKLTNRASCSTRRMARRGLICSVAGSKSGQSTKYYHPDQTVS